MPCCIVLYNTVDTWYNTVMVARRPVLTSKWGEVGGVAYPSGAGAGKGGAGRQEAPACIVYHLECMPVGTVITLQRSSKRTLEQFQSVKAGNCFACIVQYSTVLITNYTSVACQMKSNYNSVQRNVESD
jgi:hypothetical protein